MAKIWLFPLFSLLFLSGCSLTDSIADVFIPKTPREKYSRKLKRALGSDHPDFKQWDMANTQALRAGPQTQLPAKEHLLLDYHLHPSASAASYRFSLQQGRLLTIRFNSQGAAAPFAELYRAGKDEAGAYFDLVSSWDSTQNELSYLVASDATYILLMQSQLWKRSELELSFQSSPSLAFPVSGKGNAAAQSFWGAPRDGGKRSHEGVDIFAPTGTELIAITDGTVKRVKEGGLGGKVVWLYAPDEDLSLYYAHLNEQLVSEGQRVSKGDVIGTVGQTGNARTTPPHLHFGIYPGGRSPVDPWPYIKIPEGQAVVPSLPLKHLGQTIKLPGGRKFSLKDQPHTEKGKVLTELNATQEYHLVGSQGQFRRIITKEGSQGYVYWP